MTNHSKNVATLEPIEVFSEFYKLTQVPRPTFHLECIQKYIHDFAKEENLQCKQDEGGNIVIYAPGSPGREKEDSVILQGHMDMVASKGPGSVHDFLHDPIEPALDHGWIRANNTTLGADDGIGVAMIFAILRHRDKIPHPPLTCLITADEEDTPSGVFSLDGSFLRGTRYINIDSEDEATFSVGSASGIEFKAHIPLHFEKTRGQVALRLSITGLHGGHSGLDADNARISALDVLTNTVYELSLRWSISIADIRCLHPVNLIPPTADVTVTVEPGDKKAILTYLEERKADFQTDIALTEDLSSVQFTAETVNVKRTIDKKLVQEKILPLLFLLPKGILGLSSMARLFHRYPDMPSAPDVFIQLAETSSNLGKVVVEGDELQLRGLARSNSKLRAEELAHKLELLGKLTGIPVTTAEGMSAWPYGGKTPLVEEMVKAYQGVYGHPPVLVVNHAGLEAGVISRAYHEATGKNLDSISIGPTIEGAHTPKERLLVESVGRIWKVLLQVLAN